MDGRDARSKALLRAVLVAVVAVLALGLPDREHAAEARERHRGAAWGVFEYGARVQAPKKFLERRSFLHNGQLDGNAHAVALRWLVEHYGHTGNAATMQFGGQPA